MSHSLKLKALAAVASALALSLAACSPGPVEGGSSASPGQSFTIGTAVIVDHPSLQLIRDGFADVLKENNVKVTYIDENAEGDQSNVATIATQFHDNTNIDLILAISTPIAQAIVNVEQDRPILYAGVTDPVNAGLVPHLDQPSGKNVTGTSDLNPNAKPVELIQSILPNAKTIGVLYSSSEANSSVQVQAYKTAAAPLGITIKESAITNSSEIATGVQALANVDAILIPTDNTVVSGLASVISFGEQNKIPIFTADAESVVKGSVATRGLSYYELGRRTGEMALKILVEGVDVATVPALVVKETQLLVNPGAAAKMGVTIPESVLKDAKVVETAR